MRRQHILHLFFRQSSSRILFRRRGESLQAHVVECYAKRGLSDCKSRFANLYPRQWLFLAQSAQRLVFDNNKIDTFILTRLNRYKFIMLPEIENVMVRHIYIYQRNIKHIFKASLLLIDSFFCGWVSQFFWISS